MKSDSKIKNLILVITLNILIILFSTTSFAKTKVNRAVQEVNFAEMNLKGTIRNPDGAYLVQKRGVQFMPLYELQKNMDAKIRETSLHFQ